MRTAIERSFIYSFSPFAKKGESERKRLKFFMPDDFYSISLRKIEKPGPFTGLGIEDLTLRLATREDWIFAKHITDEMLDSAMNRGCGISKRSPLSVIRKMIEGKAIIAVTLDNEWV
jgi:hypothetical protein